ncbi:proline racemase family protein [Verrucomicrobia bacterium]|nr:proline racemase family protein [Verrucomicrobiota bacterium]MDB4664933.1 proline racemase family protein [Verrucomicrobiota bacterium]
MPISVPSVHVIDSHTEGEPTRVIIEGGPDLGQGSMKEKAERFARDFDGFRRSMILEPRGSDILVGALLCPPSSPACVAGVIFFNNVGLLGMCGHGTIGVAMTLAHLDRLKTGRHAIETPVGAVGFELLGGSLVSIENVPSWRYRKDVELQVEGLGTVVGDIAWGGNWFFLTRYCPCPLTVEHVDRLTAVTLQIRRHLDKHAITGARGERVDHVELFAAGEAHDAHSRNFVLCPGAAYDRSPCGTGTSAKLACLAADGLLAPGKPWVQESVIGSRFEASFRVAEDSGIIPSIRGSAHVYSEARLLCHPDDPFVGGVYHSRMTPEATR